MTVPYISKCGSSFGIKKWTTDGRLDYFEQIVSRTIIIKISSNEYTQRNEEHGRENPQREAG